MWFPPLTDPRQVLSKRQSNLVGRHQTGFFPGAGKMAGKMWKSRTEFRRGHVHGPNRSSNARELMELRAVSIRPLSLLQGKRQGRFKIWSRIRSLRSLK